MWPGLAIVLKAEASLSQAEWEARAHRAVSRTKKCSTVQRRRSPVTLTQIPAARSPAACSTTGRVRRCSAFLAAEQQRQLSDLLHGEGGAPARLAPNFPASRLVSQAGCAHTRTAAAAEQDCARQQSRALSRGVAQAGGAAAAGPRCCCCSYPTRVTTMTRASPVTHRKKGKVRPSGLINGFLAQRR